MSLVEKMLIQIKEIEKLIQEIELTNEKEKNFIKRLIERYKA